MNELLHLDEWWDVDIDEVINFLVMMRSKGATHLNIENNIDDLDGCTNSIDLIPTIHV